MTFAARYLISHRDALAALAPRARRLLVDQVRRYAAGEPLVNVVIGPQLTNRGSIVVGPSGWQRGRCPGR